MNTHIRDNFTECLLRGGTVPLTASWDAGSYEIRAETFESDVAPGTAPFVVSSSTAVSNLNADEVDGQDRVLTINADHTHESTGAQGGVLTVSATPDVVPKNVLTASGDLPYANGASSWTRLPKGTANQALRMNATASAPEWAAGTQFATAVDTTSSRVLSGTIYQNTSGNLKRVDISYNSGGYASTKPVFHYIGSSSSPATEVAQAGTDDVSHQVPCFVSFIVPNGWYYKSTASGNPPTPLRYIEYG